MRAATADELRPAGGDSRAIYGTVFASWGGFLGSQTVVSGEIGAYLEVAWPPDLVVYAQLGVGGGFGAGFGPAIGGARAGAPFSALSHQVSFCPVVGGTNLLLNQDRPWGVSVSVKGPGVGVYMVETKTYPLFSLREFVRSVYTSLYTAVRYGF